MSDMGGKTYKDTAPLGADVDLTDERELEAVRAAKRDGTIGEAYGSGSVGERLADGAVKAGSAIRDSATGLYEAASRQAQRRIGDGWNEGRTMVRDVIEERPVQLLLGAALVGFLFGRFG